MKRYLTIILFFSSLSAYANEWSGNLALENRQFDNSGVFPAEFKQYGSASIQAEWFHEWEGGKQSINFVPFIRWDQRDDERTHSDIRELSWLKVFDESELRVGLRKVFWGVTESQHLTDVINQTDLVENTDGEEKLGQPMINYAFINDWGTVDLFVLPYFRERTFAGIKGRLRTALYVDTKNPIYESSKEEKHIDYAIRWAHSLGDWDVGLSYFDGTSRAPSFVTILDGSGNSIALRPDYKQLQQFGLDLQATMEAWLWKFEVVNRDMSNDSYNAATFGFEYTFNGVFESASDIGFIMEYLYDDRNQVASSPFEDDLMLGMRWASNDENDTSILFGVIADRDESTRLYSIEASRRLGENWKLNLEARVFSGINDSNNLFYSVREDDFIQLELAYYF